MKLLTKEIIKQFERQGYTGNKKPEEVKIILKIFNPYGIGTWYLYEHLEDNIYMAFVNLNDPQMAECGTVDLNELQNIRVKPFNLGLERDISFGFKTSLKEVINKVKNGGHI